MKLAVSFFSQNVYEESKLLPEDEQPRKIWTEPVNTCSKRQDIDIEK